MRGLRAFAGFVILACIATTAHAQMTIGSPGPNASIGPHRLFASHGELVWASFIGIHALDPSTGQTRSLSHCGQVITDIALDDGWVYILADRSQLCRVSLATGSVQLLVGSPGAVIDGFAVSSSAVAYSQRRVGQQPILRVIQWNGQIRDHVCAVSAEHVAVDATHAYWIDSGTLVRASITTGAKIDGPTITNTVRRLRVDRGNVYVATDHDVLRLDAASKSWTTLSVTGADDLVADGASVYWASRGAVVKYGAHAPLFTGHPYAIALDASSLFVADDPFVLKQILPRSAALHFAPMEVKAVVIGVTKLPKALVANARKSGGRFWIALPTIHDDDESDELVDRTAKKLGGEPRAIEVAMSVGLRGEDVSATTYIAPGRQDEQDLTELAAEMIAEVEGPFDEDVATIEIAWALVDALAKAMAQ